MALLTEGAVAPQGQGSWLHTALGMARTPRARRAAQVVAAGAAVFEVGRKVQQQAKSRVTYTVSLSAGDDAYPVAHRWLFDQVSPRARRSLAARTSRPSRNHPEAVDVGSSDRSERRAELHLFYDGKQAQRVRIDGHRVTVTLEREDLGASVSINTDAASWWKPLERLVFTCYGTTARDAVVEFLRGLAEQLVVQPTPRFYIATRWGDWRRLSDLPARRLDSVVLRAGQKEAVVADLEKFLASEHLYGRIGLPWHRGYVLHGPPGTGKTTMAKALAQHFGLDVYYVPLSDLQADTNLLGLLGNVDPRSMLVLEDIDVVHAAVSRDDAESTGVSMSGLLNALDGLTTPHGLVTVMTTNNLGVLDSALVRAGRADRIEELGFLDDDQASRLAELLIGPGTFAAVQLAPDRKVTHAEMIEVAKPYLDDEAAMAQALIATFHGHGLQVPA